MTRILVIGPKELFRVGIRCLLSQEIKRRLELIDSIDEVALSVCREFKPKIVLVDIDIPRGSGLELVTRLVQSDCQPRVIIVTGEREPNVLNHQMETGATGFLTKSCRVDDCIAAVAAAIRGHAYASERYARMVTLGKIGGAEEDPLKKLSRREMDVLVMLAEGKSHQEVAELLAISQKTVASYKYRIHQKLNTRNTADITRIAVKSGLLTHS